MATHDDLRRVLNKDFSEHVANLVHVEHMTFAAIGALYNRSEREIEQAYHDAIVCCGYREPPAPWTVATVCDWLERQSLLPEDISRLRDAIDRSRHVHGGNRRAWPIP